MIHSIYLDSIKSNVAKKQSDKENGKDDNSVVASTSSASSRELGDTPKPETKVCKRYKEQTRLETRMIEYLEKSSSNIEQPKCDEDVISLQMASLGEMICSSVPANKHFDILIKLANELHRYISTLNVAKEPAVTTTNSEILFNNSGASNYTSLTTLPLAELNQNSSKYLFLACKVSYLLNCSS